MNDVQVQYETYPYPERDPKDEKKRLITGSPSHPLEIDHFVFGGKRDWSKPLRALVAGGGTGDALIQLSQVLTSAKRSAEIIYLDLSTASRGIAEERARIRGLNNITFVTDSLLNAPEYGEFDYIDCCGVLHHLPDPQAGFDALAKALAPGGGLGFMVYAPYGRSGVYPLQEAFGTLLAGLAPEERLKQARRIFKALPDSHPFKRNPHLVDHNQGDAGFYDLLLHTQDQPFTVRRLAENLGEAGLVLSGFTQPGLYDPRPFLPENCPVPEDPVDAMAVAEKLRGTTKVHVGYAVKSGREKKALALGSDMALVPHLKGVPADALARQIAKKGEVSLTPDVEKIRLSVPKAAAPLIAGVNGRNTLAEIAGSAGMGAFEFGATWRAASKPLSDYGLLLYSGLLRG